LRGMPLVAFSCQSNPLSDLAPLRGMGLDTLNVEGTGASDVSPLAGLKLKTFTFTPAKITRGIEVIRKMDSLQKIGPSPQQLYPPKEFWERYDRGEFGKPKAAP